MSLTQIVREAPFEVFLGALGIVTAMTGVSVFAGARSWWQMRALGSVSPVPIGKVDGGYVRIEGHAEPSGTEPLVAPLTRAPVCWYRIRVEDSKPVAGQRDESIHWRTVRSHTSVTPFAIRDPSGTMLINPDGADVTPTDRSIWYGATPEPEDRDPPRFSPGQNPKGDIIQFERSGGGAHRYRYTEERIYPGDPIFVQGEHRLAFLDSDEHYDDAVGTGRVEDEQPTDERLDASLDAEEDDDGTEEQEHWCIATPTRRSLPYLIATTSPADMVNIYRWGIIGTGVFAAAGLAVIVQIIRMRFG